MKTFNKDDIIKNQGSPDPEKWDWWYIRCYLTLSEDFIREFLNYLDWYHISSRQILSENFIREFQDKVDWGSICRKQKLSESFIREFKDKDYIVWYFISKYQTLSEDFINEFKDKLDMPAFIIYNPSCAPDIRIKYLKDNNLIKKQDPTTHDFEYETLSTPSIKSTNNDLQLLKELIC